MDAIDALSDAIDTTRDLLTPIELRTWLKFALIVFFVSSLGFGGTSAPAGDFGTFADESAVFAVEGDSGRAGTAYRTRIYDRQTDDGETETWAEYGVGAWDDVDAARALFAAIARDAATVAADRTRVVIPETATFVTDAAYAGAALADEPDFVLEIDLSATA